MATTKAISPLAVGLEEAAAMISIAPRTLRSWASSRKIRSIKLNRLLMFYVADLEDFLRQHERPARENTPDPISRGGAGEKARRALQVVGAAARGPLN
jgi:hypothetical protein